MSIPTSYFLAGFPASKFNSTLVNIFLDAPSFRAYKALTPFCPPDDRPMTCLSCRLLRGGTLSRTGLVHHRESERIAQRHIWVLPVRSTESGS